MIPETDFFKRIDDYCLNLLDANEMAEFEKELASNEELREELQLHKDIQNAVVELDVLTLRDALDEIQKENVVPHLDSGSFVLDDELTKLEELNDELSFEELMDSFESLPKVHVYQHEKASNENVHHYYEEQQNESEPNGIADGDMDGVDISGLGGLEEAVLESDIMSLRETIQQVAKSVDPQYSVQEIDRYLSGEMGEDILADFEAEMTQNESLQNEVSLHKDLENAIGEDDIMSLREEMHNIMASETSWNVSEENIEDFIDGVLEDDLLDEFNTELSENTDLIAEVSLREEVNDAIGEKDIQSLRARLSDVRDSVETKEVKSIVMPQFNLSSTRFWRNSVAMIVIVVGLSGVLSNNFTPLDKTYGKYFNSPTWASERSATEAMDNIHVARTYYQGANYDKVIDVLNEASLAPDKAFVAHFYKGLSYQHLNVMDKAAEEYSKVIAEGNNMFIEEAEWYRSLCYLKMNKKAEAKQQLLAVIDRKGHYEKDAKAILRRLRYKIK